MGAMSMIDTGNESFPMVAIFILLAYAVCTGLKRDFPLIEINTLIVGYDILMMISKEINKHGCGCLWVDH